MKPDQNKGQQLEQKSQGDNSQPLQLGEAERPALQRLLEGHGKLDQSLQDLGGSNAFLRQQVSQLYEAVRQLYGAVSAQCSQLTESDRMIVDELRKFQTGGPQRAMAGVYAKLFRDLIQHMNQLDDMIRLAEQGSNDASVKSWIESVRVARGGLETVFTDWGCTAIVVRLGEDRFDPEVHEAVRSDGAEGASDGGDRIARVMRRGWLFGGTVLQYPQVLVN